jgi:hypothetical protein
MVSPYLLKPVRTLQEAIEGVRARAAQRAAKPPASTLKAEGPGVQFWDSRIALGPRLIWTNSAKPPRRR